MNTVAAALPSFENLYDFVNAPISWYLLKTALELKVFDHLARPRSAESLAGDLGAHPGNTGVLLDGLAACGLLSKEQGQYRNAPVAEAFLVEGGDTYLGEMLTTLARLRQQGLENLVELVKEGPPPPPREVDLGREKFWSEATGYLANYQRAGVAQEALTIVSALPEYPSLRKMLDLAGGPGLVGMTIVRSHPHLQGVLFDLPRVVEAARVHIRELGLDGRVEVRAGDYTRDPLGEDYDLVWASLSLYFARSDFAAMMRRICEALRPGGVFVSYHEGLTHERTRPACHVIGRIAPAFRGQDFSFARGEIAEAMLAAGFRSVRSVTLATCNGPIDLDIGRR